MNAKILKASFSLMILAGVLMAAASRKETSPAQKESPAGTKGGGAADLTNGKAVYTKSCVKCHAADGKGNPGIAKMLKVTLRPLGSPEVLAKTDAQLVKDITQGAGKMKPVPLADKDAQDVVAYMRAFKEKDKDKQ